MQLIVLLRSSMIFWYTVPAYSSNSRSIYCPASSKVHMVHMGAGYKCLRARRTSQRMFEHNLIQLQTSTLLVYIDYALCTLGFSTSRSSAYSTRQKGTFSNKIKSQSHEAPNQRLYLLENRYNELKEQKEIDNIFNQLNMFTLTTCTWCSQPYNKITELKRLFTHATMIKV